jgi:capsular polysaccharide transport system permease protein
MSLNQETKRGALERARATSQALADAARRARFSTRSRRNLSSGGFKARRGAFAMRVFLWVSLAVIFVIPSAAITTYLMFFASNQYEAEAQFTVMGGEVPAPDGIAAATGFPAMAIIQDTQIVTNYVQSRAAVEKIDADIDLRGMYSRPEIDAWARFSHDKPIEKFVKYWRGMTSVSIGMPAGIVTFRVKAFSPQDAHRIADEVLKISEDLINQLNARMNRDAVKTAEQELSDTAKRLAAALTAMEKARNEEGVLDTGKTGEALVKLSTELRGQVARLQGSYDATLTEVDETAPQMHALKARIDAAKGQIADIDALLTTNGAGGSGHALSASISRFGEVDLERQVAERLYAGAVASLELAKMVAEHKMMYLNVFVSPVEPEEPRYPRRLLDSAIAAFGSLAVWGALFGLVSFARNHMA